MSNFGTTEYMLEVAKGNIPGTSKIHKFGANVDVAVGVEEDVWTDGGTYPWPTTAVMTYCSQKVDQVAMRGAQIEWQGLDANWDEVSVLVTLDGADTTTPVLLSTPLIRVFRGDVDANVVADQNITLHNTANDVDYGIIEAGFNQTTMALYTVPRGKTAYMTQYYCTVVDVGNQSTDSTRFALYTADRLKNYEFQLKHVIGMPSGGAAAIIPFNPPAGGDSASEMTDIKITARPIGSNANVAAGFSLIIVDN